MIGLAVAQIFLRNVFDAGFSWGDVLVRILVLWIGLAGAMAASRDGKHINIDIVTRYLPVKTRKIANCTIELFTGIICTIAAWYSLKFVLMEYEYGGKAFADIPVWLCESIIPFAFAVIAVRYFVLSFMSFKSVLNKGGSL
ncbi:MAG: TRAP transporter small permease [Desulfobacterales bacterium]|nr:TRAP transporter small permease [Desulfobacterales bacterium]